MTEYKTTHREALEAEMLGDIGKLHDQVEALKNALPRLLTNISAALANIEANSKTPHEIVRQEFERYVRNQILAIKGSTDQVKRAVLYQLSAEIASAVDEGWSSSKIKGDKLFKEAGEKFNSALLTGVESAEARAIATMKGLCMDLKVEIDTLNLKKAKKWWILMTIACIITGFSVGIIPTLRLG